MAYPIRAIFRGQLNLIVRRATVTGVELDARFVQVAAADPIPFEYVVLGVGSRPAFHGIVGAEQHSLPLYSLADAVRLRNHLLGRFEAADADQTLVPRGATTVTVVGAGPTGVEVAGAVIELIDKVLRHDFPGVDVDRSRVVLLETANAVLPAFRSRSQQRALRALERRGVEVRVGESVRRVTADGVHLASGERIDTQTLVWAAGVQESGLAAGIDAERNPAGRLITAADLRVPGRTNVFAVGDMARIAARGGEQAQLAAVAIQSGAHAGHQIVRLVAGETTRPFHYRDRGMMATIGRNAAVADLRLRVTLGGRLAWLAWLGLHLVTLIGFRNRLSVLVNWAWSYLTWDRGPRLILEPDVRPGRELSAPSDQGAPMPDP